MRTGENFVSLQFAGSRFESVFLQKGAGGALRDYSKMNPTAVIEFVQQHQLAPLTKREGLRWVKKMGYLD